MQIPSNRIMETYHPIVRKPKGRSIALSLIALVLMLAYSADADELPPGLEEVIGNPKIPIIVDATITRFNQAGHAEIRVHSVYKAPKDINGAEVKVPTIVRGYASVSKNQVRVVPLRVITDKGKKRFLFFLNGDLLFSTYNNRFEIRSSKDKQLLVHTGRAWKPLKEVVNLIPKKTSRK